MPILDPTLAFVIAHYNPDGRVPRDLFNLVTYISKLSNRIVFVSTNISESEINKLTPYAQVIARENFGYDFWSYKLGMQALGNLAQTERIVFFNSSFITLAPEILMANFLKPVSGKALRGLTVSNYPKLHVQSYLFAFETSALINSTDFKDWWERMIPLSNRDEVVNHYEIGMSDWFIKCGVPIASTLRVDRKDIVKSIHHILVKRNWKISDFAKLFKMKLRSYVKIHQNLNPTHFLWMSLYSQCKILKIDLIKNNPTNQDLNKLFQHVDQHELALIKDAMDLKLPAGAY